MDTASAAALPPGTDWAWRPGPWQLPVADLDTVVAGASLAAGASVWHDGAPGGISLRQGPARDASRALRIETDAFGGSFLSLSLDLPAAALLGLTRSNLLRVDARAEVAPPARLYARLNVCHGPNTEVMLRHMGDGAPGTVSAMLAEFDLYECPMNERRLQKIWLDLIVERPGGQPVVLHDVIVSRQLRAEV